MFCSISFLFFQSTLSLNYDDQELDMYSTKEKASMYMTIMQEQQNSVKQLVINILLNVPMIENGCWCWCVLRCTCTQLCRNTKFQNDGFLPLHLQGARKIVSLLLLFGFKQWSSSVYTMKWLSGSVITLAGRDPNLNIF